METLINRIKQFLILSSVMIVGISFLIVLMPFILLFLVYAYFKNKLFLKDYKNYLQTINGTKFFCYNNRKTGINFIEENIIPKISSDIKIIFLNGTTPESEYETKYISEALYKIKDRKGFPYLLKVEKKQIIDKSINKIVYNAICQNNKLENVFLDIKDFYTKTH